MCSTDPGQSTSRCIDVVREVSAQATVEAAVLLPCFLTVLLVMMQPVCLLYTRCVMESAAAQTARLMVTALPSEDGGADAYRAFALRRLAAVPDLAIFHAGGPNAWTIDARHAEDTGGEVSVSIEGAVQPLPVIGVFAGAFADLNAQGDAVLRVEVSFEGRPEWLEGNYDAWVEAWGQQSLGN